MSEENTKELLLSAARAELLRCGYQKASLRKICAAADVTTGALYFFFKNKEELFNCLVGDVAERLLQLVQRQTDSEVNGRGDSAAYQRELNEYLCENKDIVRILFYCSEGTAYSDFRERYCAEAAKGFYMFYDKCGGSAEYRDIMGLIVKMRIQGYIEMLNGDYDMDKMMKFSELMELYGDSGFAGMMEKFNSITKAQSVD